MFKFKRNHINNQSGIALVIALVMLLALTVIGISSLMTSTLDTQMSGNERRAAEALNLADAGVERGLMDLLTDYSRDRGGDAKWNNADFTRVSLTAIDATVTNTLDSDPVENYGDFDSNINTQWGDPFDGASLNGSTDKAVDPYDGPVELPAGSGNWYRVLLLRDLDKEDEIYMRSYAVHSTGAKKILQLHMKINTIGVWQNALFAGRGSASASITGNINVAGPVHVLGTGATNNYTISGNAGVFNGYNGLGQSGDYNETELMSRIVYDDNGDGIYDNLTAVGTDSSGNPIYSLESEFRVKNVQVELTSESATIGEEGGQGSLPTGIAEYAGQLWQSQLDNIFANKQIEGSNYYANNVGTDPDRTVEDYDLGDKLQMPSFEDPYTDDEGNKWDKYQNYIETKSITMPSSVCSLDSATTNFIVGDADSDGVCTDADITSTNNGCIEWNPGSGTKADPATIDIKGRVKFDAGCGTDNFAIGDAGGHIAYKGKGLLYGSKTMMLKGSIVTKAGEGNFIKDNLMGFLTTGNIHVSGPGDSNASIMGGLFAADLISTEMPGSIIGSLVSNEFCMGGTEPDGAGGLQCKAAAPGGQASDIYYVPKLSEVMEDLGAPTGRRIFSFKKYEWEEKW